MRKWVLQSNYEVFKAQMRCWRHEWESGCCIRAMRFLRHKWGVLRHEWESECCSRIMRSVRHKCVQHMCTRHSMHTNGLSAGVFKCSRGDLYARAGLFLQRALYDEVCFICHKEAYSIPYMMRFCCHKVPYMMMFFCHKEPFYYSLYDEALLSQRALYHSLYDEVFYHKEPYIISLPQCKPRPVPQSP